MSDRIEVKQGSHGWRLFKALSAHLAVLALPWVGPVHVKSVVEELPELRTFPYWPELK
jgi:RNA:NAD 2'-phosphotransferase (TPT1/KptA family)